MEQRIGRDLGEMVEPLIRDASSELVVASPYISRRYAELLVEKAGEGVETRVYTTRDGADYHQEALTVLEGSGGGWLRRITGFIRGLLGFQASGVENLDLTVVEDLHAKLYAADSREAVLGSCNLTYRGMTEAVEAAVKLEGREAEKPLEELENCFR